LHQLDNKRVSRVRRPPRRIEVVEVEATDPDWPERIARLTRAACAGPYAVPGLPPPAGARASAAAVVADLAAGDRIWVASDGAGDAGVVTGRAVAGHAYELRRLAVLPRRGGVAGALVRRLERAAYRAGATRVVVDAVVERATPPLYARLGYRTLGHRPSEDRPLSSVTMEASLRDDRRPLAYPWEGDGGLPRAGTLVAWFVVPDRLVAVVDAIEEGVHAAARAAADRLRARLGRAPRLAGADVYSSQARRVLELLESGGALSAGSIVELEGPAATPYALPRALDPEALALWRLPEGVLIPR
jgi:hypothetical protein